MPRLTGRQPPASAAPLRWPSCALAGLFLLGTGIAIAEEPRTEVPAARRVAVLSALAEPRTNTSQALYLRALRDAGFEGRGISAQEVRDGKLAGFGLFIIGGGSGSGFNRSLGSNGCQAVQAFLRAGGGALASCAGGYSFARGQKAELQYMTVARAAIFDAKDGRWARGTGEVDIAPEDDRFAPPRMFYANGPLWQLDPEAGAGADRTVALARFRGDIHKAGDAGGVMPGTPAILAGTFGTGRFVLFSAHPEFTKRLGNRPLIVDAARWVTRGRLAPDEPIRWADVFPSAKRVPAPR